MDRRITAFSGRVAHVSLQGVISAPMTEGEAAQVVIPLADLRQSPDGARDLPAFKRFLRSHQVPSEVFFSAYPDQTVLNIANNLAFAQACADLPVDPLRTQLRRL